MIIKLIGKPLDSTVPLSKPPTTKIPQPPLEKPKS